MPPSLLSPDNHWITFALNPQRNTENIPETHETGESILGFCNSCPCTYPPLLLLQDGQELPPAIGFDLEDGVKLPAPKASFLCDAAGAEIVRQFLEQYFIIFDSASRQPLLDAYHEQAMFSMTIGNYQHGTQGK